MKSYLKLIVVVIIVFTAVFVGSDIILYNTDKGDAGRPYRVEAQRIATKIKNHEPYDLDDYKYITGVEKITVDNAESNEDHLIKDIEGTLYRFDYTYTPDNHNTIMVSNICYGAVVLLVFFVLGFVYIRIIRPFEAVSSYPTELAKGNLTIPLKEQKGKYFGKFLWGLDLLREKLESQKNAELELKRKNSTMVMSLSHDIKTPLGVIELYSKALEKGLYKEEEKKKEIAVNINSKCEEIRSYVDGIIKTASEDIFEMEVNEGEFYLSELINDICTVYTDKLSLLKTDFKIAVYSDCIVHGDCERAVEVLQNIIENAIKYGDGKSIEISFSKEEDCQLIHISNSGCTLSDNELPHIFDSFWRGSNTGQQTGSGLGLYICRELMRKMDGDIFAVTNDGTMTVTAVFSLS